MRKFFAFHLMVGVLGSILPGHGSAAVLDPDFDPGLNEGAQVYAIALETNGNILIGGAFTSVGSIAITNIARLHPDGSLDTTFSAGSAADRGYINAIAIQPDGKIIIGGLFNSGLGLVPPNLARLNENGSPDETFDSSLTVDDAVNTVRVRPDGKILFGGAFVLVDGYQRRSVAQLKSDGSLDTSFDACVSSSSGSGATALGLQSDDKILASGRFTFSTGAFRDGIARLNPCGDIDATYAPPPGVDLDRVAYTLSMDTNEQAVLGGNFNLFHGQPHRGLVRLTQDGVPDPTFSNGTSIFYGVTIYALAMASDNTLLAGGAFTQSNGQTEFKIVKVNLDGSVDLNFDSDTGPDNSMGSLAIQPDGKVLVAGKFGSFGGKPRNGLARLMEAPPNHAPVADAGATRLLYISANGSNALVQLDGSRSSDPDQDPLQYIWYDSGLRDAIADGAQITVVLPIGNHFVTLVVTDGHATTSNSVRLEILTPGQGIERLMEMTRVLTGHSQPFAATLSAAQAAIGRDHAALALYQLRAFEKQLEAHVARRNPTLAADTIRLAETIVVALKERGTHPGSQRH